jgi:hypothetical protein
VPLQPRQGLPNFMKNNEKKNKSKIKVVSMTESYKKFREKLLKNTYKFSPGSGACN